MTATSRLIINTLAQNIRTVVNICLSLYSTRLVLEALGQSDYGIYMLVAGVVSFLSYFTTAMVTTTQRHLSYYHGQKDMSKAKVVFANSYMLNILYAIGLVFIFLSITSWLFNGATLNISPDKLDDARWVYLIILSSVFMTFVTAPFKALFIARENIVYISGIDVLDGILKVLMVFALWLFDEHRVIVYSCIISLVMLFNFMALSMYAKYKYEECCIIPSLSKWDSSVQRNLLGFTTWTIYGSVSIYLRNQGIAILLNRSFGTFINASYGIAGQILGSISFLSSAILNAFTPQIVKAEGEGKRDQMLSLSLNACKYCYLLLAVVAIPIAFEIDEILLFWLGNAPLHASLFCQMFLIAAVVDQLTTGLNVANQAIGQIRNYSLLIYTTKIIVLPLIWAALHMSISLWLICGLYIAVEIITAFIRLPYIAHTTGLQYMSFINKVLLPCFIPTLVAVISSYFMTRISPFPLRFAVTAATCVTATMIALWFFCFNNQEKNYIRAKLTKQKNAEQS